MAVALSATLMAACGGSDEAAVTEAPSTAPVVEASVPSSTTPVTQPPTTPAPTEPATIAPAATEPPATTPVTTAPATEPPTTDAPAPSTAPEAIQWAMLRVADFADGWTEVPYDPADDDDDAGTAEAIASCAGVDATLVNDEALGPDRAVSSTILDPSGRFGVQQRLGFAADEAAALAAITAIGSDAIADCYALAIEANIEESRQTSDPAATMPPGMEVGTPIVERVPIDDVSPDELVMYSAEIPFTLNGQESLSHKYLLFSRAGRVLSNLQLDGDGEPFPSDVIGELIQIVAFRTFTIDASVPA